ncbi:hypothetical protein ACN38_g13139 [Penicillium nordicum]|uniref:Uncharacterized protein n=1 Tax=Penicillium nordicum TaxID=229535 RepID=A0A0M9W9F2_9EURO|nr:hypothetical protein ACN38_g13139 [Penicillium nordicum]
MWGWRCKNLCPVTISSKVRSIQFLLPLNPYATSMPPSPPPSQFCIRCAAPVPSLGLPNRSQSVRCKTCIRSIRDGGPKWLCESRYCTICGTTLSASTKYARCAPCRANESVAVPSPVETIQRSCDSCSRVLPPYEQTRRVCSRCRRVRTIKMQTQSPPQLSSVPTTSSNHSPSVTATLPTLAPAPARSSLPTLAPSSAQRSPPMLDPSSAQRYLPILAPTPPRNSLPMLAPSSVRSPSSTHRPLLMRTPGTPSPFTPTTVTPRKCDGCDIVLPQWQQRYRRCDPCRTEKRRRKRSSLALSYREVLAEMSPSMQQNN